MSQADPPPNTRPGEDWFGDYRTEQFYESPLWQGPRITPAGSRHLDLPDASPQTGDDTSTDTWPGRTWAGERELGHELPCNRHRTRGWACLRRVGRPLGAGSNCPWLQSHVRRRHSGQHRDANDWEGPCRRTFGAHLDG